MLGSRSFEINVQAAGQTSPRGGEAWSDSGPLPGSFDCHGGSEAGSSWGLERECAGRT